MNRETENEDDVWDSISASFKLMICPGQRHVPNGLINMYTDSRGVNKFTICELCKENCSVPGDLINTDTLVDTKLARFNCDCEACGSLGHVELRSDRFSWGSYPCMVCENESQTDKVKRCDGCEITILLSRDYCRDCCLVLGVCKCGQVMTDADHSYLRTYFCLGMNIPLDGLMIGFDLMLQNVAKNKIASTIGCYRNNPLMIEKSMDAEKIRREFSYHANMHGAGEEHSLSDSETDSASIDELIFHDVDGEYELLDEDEYINFVNMDAGVDTDSDGDGGGDSSDE